MRASAAVSSQPVNFEQKQRQEQELVVERDHHGFDAPAPLGHPARAGLPDGQSTGPDIGERLPDFVLPDAHGQSIDYHRHRAGRKSIVVFYRSAVW